MHLLPCYESRGNLVQLNSVVVVVRRHIRENYPVPYLKTVLHLDSVHGTASERHLYFRSVLAIRIDLEELHRRVLLPEYRTPDEHNVVLKAGAQGAELVCLHMPQTDPAYRGQ